MSIYSILAFNAAHDQVQKNIADSQAIDAKRIQNQSDQETLDLNKKLDLAKVSQANNENTLNNYVGGQLKDNINKQYKAKQDQLDAVSGLQDIAQHKAQQNAQQDAQVASKLMATDPDVQAHAQTLAGIMKASNGSLPPSAASTVLPNLTAGNEGSSPSAPSAIGGGTGPDGARIPSIFPMTGQTPSPLQTPQQISTPGVAPVQSGASPQNVNAQVSPQVGAPSQSSSPEAMLSPQVQPQEPQGTQGIDLSPVEQAFGMPKGSMWLNPATMKPEVSPIFTNKMEAANRAQANYDVNQPFREQQRDDRNIKTAETYLVNSVKQRGSPIGIQDNKVNAAIHARQLIDQSYDPSTGQYNVTQVPYSELAESVGSLLSSGTGSSEGRIEALKQKTAQGDINGAISYFTGKPSNATSQDAIKQLVGIIDRQGLTSENLRDQAIDKLKTLPTFSRLPDGAMDELKQAHFGNSFKDQLANAPDKQQVQSEQQGQQSGSQKDYSNLWK